MPPQETEIPFSDSRESPGIESGDSDLGEFTDPKRQPPDFGARQTGDGTRLLWSCIRHTRCGGQTRLFFGWQSDALTRPDRAPKGVTMQADPGVGETPDGLQIPFVFRESGAGCWRTSRDLTNWSEDCRPGAAPEIIRREDEHCIAAPMPSLKEIQIARLCRSPALRNGRSNESWRQNKHKMSR